jgi:hypothetical protein
MVFEGCPARRGLPSAASARKANGVPRRSAPHQPGQPPLTRRFRRRPVSTSRPTPATKRGDRTTASPPRVPAANLARNRGPARPHRRGGRVRHGCAAPSPKSNRSRANRCHPNRLNPIPIHGVTTSRVATGPVMHRSADPAPRDRSDLRCRRAGRGHGPDRRHRSNPTIMRPSRICRCVRGSRRRRHSSQRPTSTHPSRSLIFGRAHGCRPLPRTSRRRAMTTSLSRRRICGRARGCRLPLNLKRRQATSVIPNLRPICECAPACRRRPNSNRRRRTNANQSRSRIRGRASGSRRRPSSSQPQFTSASPNHLASLPRCRPASSTRSGPATGGGRRMLRSRSPSRSRHPP